MCFAVSVFAAAAQAQDNSPAPILQWFDGRYETQIERAPDLFMAGYGAVWAPPPGQASGGFSVGYDVYDRFNLGSWDSKTLYGTQTGFRRFAEMVHRTGSAVHIDAVINHNAFADASTPGFLDAGGYPGFVLQNPDYDGDPDGDVTNDPYGIPNTDGDFNSGFDFGDLRGRLAGLIDINHASNWQFIRHPVNPGDPLNIPAGNFVNQPNESNRQYYPDRNGPAIFVRDPVTGENDIAIYSFNTDNPQWGDPVAENATGLLMRYMQWMVQVNGVDGFRIDAAKHMQGFTLDFMDRAVYRQNPRKLLDGSTNHVFSYSEVFDGNRAFLQTFVKKTINPNDPGTIGGNRDALDFAQYFTLKGNLTSNGQSNDWRNVVNSGMDVFDDGLKNGSAGVMFVQSHDDFGPDLGTVAHAYMLMHPGNSVVYFNAKEHGDNRDFPKNGRGDALGGVYGDAIKNLVEIRNTHGRGNYIERWLEKEQYAFEREGSALVLLSNRNDGGFDSRTLDVNLPWGTYLVELTGNAKRWNDQVGNSDIPEVLQVFDDGFNTQTKVNARFLRNNGQDMGYLVYGLATPQSANGVELTNVDSVLAGGTPDPNDFSNGTTRLTDLHVIKDDSFTIKLATNAVNLLGSIRDQNADGDNALFRVDGGLSLNGQNPNGTISGVDYDSPGSVVYGFEEFTTTKTPGLFQQDGNGLYEQVIDTSQLSEGVHFITVRAFRHRTDGGPAVFSDFKKVIYVDRLKPVSGVSEYRQVNDPSFGDHDILVESLDFTGNSMHVFLNLAESVTEQDIMDMVGNGEGAADKVDVNLFKRYFGGIGKGNNVLTVVTFEQTGTSNIQRFTGQYLNGGRGGGFGDLNHDGLRNVDDVAGTGYSFEAVLYSQDTAFNPAADINGDGRVGWADLIGLRNELANNGAQQDTLDEYDAMLLRRGNVNQEFGSDSWDIDAVFDRLGTDDWHADIDSSGGVDQADVDLLVSVIFDTYTGDTNLDGKVDVIDLSVMVNNWQQSGKRWGLADFTGDDVTDVNDLILLAENWYAHDPGAAPISSQALLASFGVVPEPGSLALLALGSVLLMGRRGGRHA